MIQHGLSQRPDLDSSRDAVDSSHRESHSLLSHACGQKSAGRYLMCRLFGRVYEWLLRIGSFCSACGDLTGTMSGEPRSKPSMRNHIRQLLVLSMASLQFFAGFASAEVSYDCGCRSELQFAESCCCVSGDCCENKTAECRCGESNIPADSPVAPNPDREQDLQVISVNVDLLRLVAVRPARLSRRASESHADKVATQSCLCVWQT